MNPSTNSFSSSAGNPTYTSQKFNSISCNPSNDAFSTRELPRKKQKTNETSYSNACCADLCRPQLDEIIFCSPLTTLRFNSANEQTQSFFRYELHVDAEY